MGTNNGLHELNPNFDGPSFDSDHLNDALDDMDGLSLEEMNTQKHYQTVIAIVCMALALTIAITNGLIIIAYARTPSLHTLVNSFLINLTVADFILAVTLAYHGLTYLVPVLARHPLVCLLRYALISTCLGATIASLLAVSVERYLSVTRPFHVSDIITRKVRVMVISTLWGLSILLGLIVPLVWPHPERDSKKVYGDKFVCNMAAAFPHGYVEYLMVPLAFMALIAVVGLYSQVLAAATAQLRAMRVLVVSFSREDQRRLSDARLVRTGCIVLGATIVCYGPFLAVVPVAMSGQYERVGWFRILQLSVTLLAYVNSIVNPLIYTTRIRGFKIAIKRLLCLHINDSDKYETYRIERNYVIKRPDSFGFLPTKESIRRTSFKKILEEPELCDDIESDVENNEMAMPNLENLGYHCTKPILIKCDSDSEYLRVKVRRLIRTDVAGAGDIEARPKSDNALLDKVRAVNECHHKKQRSLRHKLLASLRHKPKAHTDEVVSIPPRPASLAGLPFYGAHQNKAVDATGGGTQQKQTREEEIPTSTTRPNGIRRTDSTTEKIGADDISIELTSQGTRHRTSALRTTFRKLSKRRTETRKAALQRQHSTRAEDSPHSARHIIGSSDKNTTSSIEHSMLNKQIVEVPQLREKSQNQEDVVAVLTSYKRKSSGGEYSSKFDAARSNQAHLQLTSTLSHPLPHQKPSDTTRHVPSKVDLSMCSFPSLDDPMYEEVEDSEYRSQRRGRRHKYKATRLVERVGSRAVRNPRPASGVLNATGLETNSASGTGQQGEAKHEQSHGGMARTSVLIPVILHMKNGKSCTVYIKGSDSPVESEHSDHKVPFKSTNPVCAVTPECESAALYAPSGSRAAQRSSLQEAVPDRQEYIKCSETKARSLDDPNYSPNCTAKDPANS